MAAITPMFANKIINHIFHGASGDLGESSDLPKELFLGLFTAPPTEESLRALEVGDIDFAFRLL